MHLYKTDIKQDLFEVSRIAQRCTSLLARDFLINNNSPPIVLSTQTEYFQPDKRALMLLIELHRFRIG